MQSCSGQFVRRMCRPQFDWPAFEGRLATPPDQIASLCFILAFRRLRTEFYTLAIHVYLRSCCRFARHLIHLMSW